MMISYTHIALFMGFIFFVGFIIGVMLAVVLMDRDEIPLSKIKDQNGKQF